MIYLKIFLGPLVAVVISELFHVRHMRLVSRVVAWLNTSPAAWSSSTDMSRNLGTGVYNILRRFVDDGVAEVKTEPGGPERGGRDRFFYRWRHR